MHQNLAILLRQFNYGKISFIDLVPAAASNFAISGQEIELNEEKWILQRHFVSDNFTNFDVDYEMGLECYYNN